MPPAVAAALSSWGQLVVVEKVSPAGVDVCGLRNNSSVSATLTSEQATLLVEWCTSPILSKQSMPPVNCSVGDAVLVQQGSNFEKSNNYVFKGTVARCTQRSIEVSISGEAKPIKAAKNMLVKYVP